MPLLYDVVLIAFWIAVFVLGTKWLVRVIGAPCQFCSNRRLTPLDEMPDLDRQAILSYFRDAEDREADISGVFVCRQCKHVFDDFSGLKRRMDTDDPVTALPHRTLDPGTRLFCKACNQIIEHCEPHNPAIDCPQCGTHYAWRTDAGSGYVIFMADPGTRVLKRCESAADFWGI